MDANLKKRLIRSFSILFEILNKNNELVIIFDKFQFEYKLFNK